MLHIMAWIVFEIQRPCCSIHEGRRPHGEPMREFVGGVLGIRDLGADFLVVLPPGPFLTIFRLALWDIGWRSRKDERTIAHAVDDCPWSGEMVITMRTSPLPWITHLQLAQLFISLLASTLSQKEHWIGIVSEPKEGVS